MTLSFRRSRQKPTASTTRRRVSTSSRLPQGERYTPARKAEFLLNNAGTEAEYLVALREVKALGLDPDAVPHVRPNSR